MNSAEHHPMSAVNDALTAVPMVFDRARGARLVAELVELRPQDQVIDTGCGPGTALRVASLRCSHATGVDRSPAMLRFGRWLNWLRRRRNVTLVEGTEEVIPPPSESATIIWALSSVHHWTDRAQGLAETRRVLVPGGRVLLVERSVKPGESGQAAHGLTDDQAAMLVDELATAGFIDPRCETRVAGYRTLVVVSALK